MSAWDFFFWQFLIVLDCFFFFFFFFFYAVGFFWGFGFLFWFFFFFFFTRLVDDGVIGFGFGFCI